MGHRRPPPGLPAVWTGSIPSLERQPKEGRRDGRGVRRVPQADDTPPELWLRQQWHSEHQRQGHTWRKRAIRGRPRTPEAVQGLPQRRKHIEVPPRGGRVLPCESRCRHRAPRGDCNPTPQPKAQCKSRGRTSGDCGEQTTTQRNPSALHRRGAERRVSRHQ